MAFKLKSIMQIAAGAVFAAGLSTGALGQDTVKIGLIVPMTGGQASTGKQIDNAIKLYMQQNGSTVAGKKIEVILKDDAAVPDNSKRLAQELIVNDKVHFLAGFGVTPAALAVAPLATQGKVPQVIMAAGTSIITERSPYIVRTSFTLAQSSEIIADWAAKRGIDRAKFEATWKSFGVNTQLARARDLTNRFEADGVPSLGINGKYYISLGGTRSEKRLFEVADKLIADERARK